MFILANKVDESGAVVPFLSFYIALLLLLLVLLS